MQMPAIFKGESLTRLAQGAAVGAAATMIIGFNWGGIRDKIAASKKKGMWIGRPPVTWLRRQR